MPLLANSDSECLVFVFAAQLSVTNHLYLTTMAALAQALPAPIYTSTEEVYEAPLQAAPKPVNIPSYGSRKGWKPSAADYNGGGAYPECHVAQYPLDMGRKKPAGAGSTLALQVDADGTVRYDAIAQYGRAHGSKVQSSFKGKSDLFVLSLSLTRQTWSLSVTVRMCRRRIGRWSAQTKSPSCRRQSELDSLCRRSRMARLRLLNPNMFRKATMTPRTSDTRQPTTVEMKGNRESLR